MTSGWAQAVPYIASTVKDMFSTSGESSARAIAAQYAYNLSLQKQAQSWNEHAYKHRYQWQVEDLDKAGINKLYGLGTAPAITSGLNSVGMPDFVGEKNAQKQRALEMIGLAQDWSAKKAQIEKMKAETKTEEQNKELKTMETLDKAIEALKNKKELDKWDEKYLNELEKTKSEIAKNYAEKENAIAQTETARAVAENQREQAKTEEKKRQEIQANTNKLNEMKEELKRTNDWHKKHKLMSEISIASKELQNLADEYAKIKNANTNRKNHNVQKAKAVVDSVTNAIGNVAKVIK